MPVPSSDRVLIHLYQRGEPRGWTGGISDQDLIAVKCGIGRTHIPRVVKPLMDDGKILEDLGRSPGRQRRVKVYSLTTRGRELARSILEEILSKQMKWKDEDGNMREGSVEVCHQDINTRLFEISMEKIPLSLFLSMDLEGLKWNDIIWISSSIPRETEKGPETPDGWRKYHPRDKMEGMPFSREKLEEVDRAVKEEGMVLLKGASGSGKKDLIELWLRSRNRKGLWLEKGDGQEGVCIEGGPWDVLVLLDGGDPGVASLLLDEVSVTDPRDDQWPEQLSCLDLLMTTEVDLDMKGPVVQVSGIEWDLFLEICVRKGLENDLSRKIFDASRGSPRAIRYLAGLSDDEVDEINSMEEENAVLRVLLAIK